MLKVHWTEKTPGAGVSNSTDSSPYSNIRSDCLTGTDKFACYNKDLMGALPSVSGLPGAAELAVRLPCCCQAARLGGLARFRHTDAD